MKNPKSRGELAELAFLFKAASLSLIVSKPYGDTAPFDFIVLGNGKLSRIQVKSAAALAQRRYYIINSKLGGRHRPVRSYDRRHIDFLVAYLVPEESWYILPPRIFLRRTQLAIPSCRSRGGNRFLPYLGAWDQLFDLDAPGFTIHASADCNPESV